MREKKDSGCFGCFYFYVWQLLAIASRLLVMRLELVELKNRLKAGSRR